MAVPTATTEARSSTAASGADIIVDTLGLLLAVTVTMLPAAADDGTAAPQVLVKLNQDSYPRLKPKLFWGGTPSYRNHALDGWMSGYRPLVRDRDHKSGRRRAGSSR